MKRRLSKSGKIRTAASLIVVFLLVITTNVIDKTHFEIVQKSMTTVYEDRLVAKEYLYKISRQLQLKRNAFYQTDQEGLTGILIAANDSINHLIELFADTRLTEIEGKRLNGLKSKLEELKEFEKNQPNNQGQEQSAAFQSGMNGHYAEVFQVLDALVEIQVAEGRRETMNSERAIESSNFISQLEIGALIILGLLIQLVIFLKPQK